MNIKIRQLGIDDLELLLDLRMEVLSCVFSDEKNKMTAEEWSALREENRRYYLAESERGGHIACAAFSDDKIAGCGGICLYREMPSPDNRNGICGYLMNIYTREEFRNAGVGKAVCDFLIDRAKKFGAEKIYLETSECGKNFYHSLGFREMKDYLKLSEIPD